MFDKRLIAMLLLCGAAPAALAVKYGEVIEGPEGLVAWQEQGVIWDKVVMTWQGEAMLTGRLSLHDRAGLFQGDMGGTAVEAYCHTFNGYSLEVDCRLYRQSDRQQVAHLRIPLL